MFAHFTSNWSFAHLTASGLHTSGWCNWTDLHIWGRSVCTSVVVSTFQGKMLAQMQLFAHLWVFAHFTAPQPSSVPCMGSTLILMRVNFPQDVHTLYDYIRLSYCMENVCNILNLPTDHCADICSRFIMENMQSVASWGSHLTKSYIMLTW